MVTPSQQFLSCISYQVPVGVVVGVTVCVGVCEAVIEGVGVCVMLTVWVGVGGIGSKAKLHDVNSVQAGSEQFVGTKTKLVTATSIVSVIEYGLLTNAPL